PSRADSTTSRSMVPTLSTLRAWWANLASPSPGKRAARVVPVKTHLAPLTGILQSVNVVTKTGVRDSGEWVEVYFYLCPEKLHTHIRYGIDDPLDHHLAPGQPVRNETYFANLIWDVTKHFRVAGEVTYRKTAYTLVPNNDGIGFHTQVQWRF